LLASAKETKNNGAVPRLSPRSILTRTREGFQRNGLRKAYPIMMQQNVLTVFHPGMLRTITEGETDRAGSNRTQAKADMF
jgi:hypothetical protein